VKKIITVLIVFIIFLLYFLYENNKEIDNLKLKIESLEMSKE